jgi:hypothetical protein
MAVATHPPCACPHEEQMMVKWLENYHQKKADATAAAVERNQKALDKVRVNKEKELQIQECNGDEYLAKNVIVADMGINKLRKVALALGIRLISCGGLMQETPQELIDAILDHPCTARKLEKI